jgi:hypothetical protein
MEQCDAVTAQNLQAPVVDNYCTDDEVEVCFGMVREATSFLIYFSC